MITFIFIAVGALLVLAAIGLAYAANNRKRAGQSGASVSAAQTEHMSEPEVSRPTGLN